MILLKWLGKNTTVTQTKLRPFFEELEKGNLCAGLCQSCGMKFYPPRSGCPECHQENIELIPLSKSGKLAAFTQIHYGPSAFQSEVPYTIGILELEEEKLRIMGWIKTPVEELKVGMQLVWELKPNNSDSYLLFLNPP